MKTTIGQFKNRASLPQQAIVVLFDLEGFSHFFSQPDVQDYVPKYLNIVLDAVHICFRGSETPYWRDNPKKMMPLPPMIHSKFLGDGALYIFKYNDFSDDERVHLINRLWNLKDKFNKVVEKATDEIPILDIPKKIRFGISAGTVYRLTYSHVNREEYIGYSINLASRLQNYSREVGMIISGRLNIATNQLETNLYTKVVAKDIKGFPDEIVIVDKNDYDKLAKKTRDNLFVSL